MGQNQDVSRSGRPLFRALHRVEATAEADTGHQEMLGKRVGPEFLPRKLSPVVKDGDLGLLSIGKEMAVFVNKRPSPAHLRVTRIDRDTTAELWMQEKHTGNMRVCERKGKDAESDVSFEQRIDVADRAVTQAKSIALRGRNVLCGLFDRCPLRLITGRIASRQRCLEGSFKFAVPLAELFKPLDIR